MNRSLPKSTIRLFSMALLLGGASTLRAQDLKTPEPGFTDACASASFNSFSVSFKWQPTAMVAADNKFILELSDANGNFSQPYTLSSFSDKNTTYDFTFNFSMPDFVAGDAYKVRVRSTNPAKTSPESVAFGAYFVKVNEPLIINNFQEAALCEQSVTFLEIDNYPGEAAYNWYKDMSLIPGAKGAVLEVTEPGIYFAEIDYGPYCSVSTASNLVEVYMESTVGFALLGETEVALCDNQTYTLSANIQDPNATYTWYKDGAVIAQGKQSTLNISSASTGYEGTYFAEFIVDGAVCIEQSEPITVKASGFDLSLQPLSNYVVLPGETKTIKSTTTAVNPTFQWYKNGVALSGANAADLQVSEPGSYYLEVSGNSGCVSAKTSSTIVIEAPERYEATIAAANYTECSSSQAQLQIQAITAVDSKGNRLSLPQNYWSNVQYQWMLNGQAISGANSASYTVSDPLKNGNYSVQLTADLNNTFTSNVLPVKLGINENLQITASELIYCSGNGAITLNSNVTSSSYTYTWYKDGVSLSGNSSSFQTNLTGTYSLRISRDGCTLTSNEVTIAPFNDASVQLNVGSKTLIAEGESILVTAGGADSYQWFNSNQEFISAGSSVNLSAEGVYYMKATVGGCEVIREFELAYQVSTVVPNVITANGDGFNDLWILPGIYAYQPDITVKIYEQSGVNVLNTNNYQNNWPDASVITSAGKRPPVYYYSISKGKQVLKQGTITVLK